MELDRVIVDNDIPISEQTLRDLVDDERFNFLKCVSNWHAPSNLPANTQIRLFAYFYLPSQKDCINPSIPISAPLKIVIRNRALLTQAESGHPFR